MNRVERRRALEAIAMSRDPSLTGGDRLRALELLDRLGDPEETAGEAISAEVSAMSGHALDAELDALLAGLIRDGGIGRFPETAAALTAEVERRVISRTVKVHVPEPEPTPAPKPTPISPPERVPERTSTYSNAFYEALGIPVAAELDR